LDFFLRRRRKRRRRAMRARPRRGPITAPAIQALLEDFFSVVVEMSVGVAVSVSALPSLSVVLAAAVAERRAEDTGKLLISCGSGTGAGTDWLWSLRRRAGRGSRTS
jgi:hypothetical protein